MNDIREQIREINRTATQLKRGAIIQLVLVLIWAVLKIAHTFGLL